MKNKLLILGFLLLITIVSVEAVILSEFSDRECDEIICKQNIYSNQRYFQSNGNWQKINENFNNQNCLTDYDYCVLNNLYQVHIKNVNSPNSIKFIRDGYSIEFQPVSFNIGPTSLPMQTPTVSVNNNKIFFNSLLNNINIQYIYLPRMFKEEIIINSLIPAINEDLKVKFKINTNNLNIQTSQGQWNQIDTITTDDEITISNNENPLFYLINPIAYDSRHKTVNLQYELSNTNNELFLTIRVPYNFLINESTQYPIYIDPTISLDSNNVTFDGYIENDNLGGYTRMGTGDIAIGVDENLDPVHIFRGVYEWNINNVPTNTKIIDINFTVSVESVGADINLTFRAMDGNSTTYPDTNTGNQNFYNDMSNGAYISNSAVTVGIKSFNLSKLQGNVDLENALTSHRGWWSFGLHSSETTGLISLASKENANAAKRPKLIIKYEPVANETEGDNAIQQGILNILPNAIIYNDQQINTRDWNNVRQSGRFDKFAFNSTLNKRWAFNYITSGESFTNMANLSKSVFILELTNLDSAQITSRVEQFILGTKDL